ncbi:MAG TPA: thioredoxin domain-containing protein [Nitrospiraceae bacterium]
MIVAVTDREFDQVIERAGMPVLVEFWQPGCGECRALLGELELLQAETAGRLLILMMNVQENFQIPAELEVASLPALALYRNEKFDRFIGGLGKKDAILKQLALPER